MAGDSVDLAAALATFDKVEANLVKLEAVWRKITASYPDDYEFGLNTPDLAALLDSFTSLAGSLPAIDGYSIDATPMSPDDLSHARLGYFEIGEPLGRLRLDDEAEEPGRQIAVYRRRLEGSRRRLVGDHTTAVIERIDSMLLDVDLDDGRATWRHSNRWGDLTSAVSELERLIGSMVPGQARWSDLHRHLRFAATNDLWDIVTMDWPSVKEELWRSLYGDQDPVPVGIDDLAQLVAARPTGPVSSRLDWTTLDDEQFEALVFELVRHADGYENANWLMATRASDRGRDIEVYRVISDPLSTTQRNRVIVQCKHWRSKPVGRRDLIECLESVKLWEPPKIDVVIVATSGRFSQDAVALAEKRNQERTLPLVELWPDNHLELLLARRPHLTTRFGLRHI